MATSGDSEFDQSSRTGKGNVSLSGFNQSYLEADGKRALSSGAPTPGFQVVSSQGTFKQVQAGGFASDDRVNLNLRDASIEAAAQAIIGDILQKAYVISPQVEGTVSVVR